MWTKICPECEGTGHKKFFRNLFIYSKTFPKQKICSRCRGTGEIKGTSPFSKPKYIPEE